MEELNASITWISPVVPPTNQPGPPLHTVGLIFLHFDVYLGTSLVDGVPWAQGTGSEKGEAREAAARNCYMLLRPQ